MYAYIKNSIEINEQGKKCTQAWGIQRTYCDQQQWRGIVTKSRNEIIWKVRSMRWPNIIKIQRDGVPLGQYASEEFLDFPCKNPIHVSLEDSRLSRIDAVKYDLGTYLFSSQFIDKTPKRNMYRHYAIHNFFPVPLYELFLGYKSKVKQSRSVCHENKT